MPHLRAPLIPRLAERNEGQELIAGLDSLLGRMLKTPLDSFYGRSAR
ncbi:hypothetical protein AB0L26_08095 [Streptomyces nondiastaticus]